VHFEPDQTLNDFENRLRFDRVWRLTFLEHSVDWTMTGEQVRDISLGWPRPLLHGGT